MQSNVTQQRVPIDRRSRPLGPRERKSAPRARYFRRRDDCGQQAGQARTRVRVLPAYYFPKEDVRTDLFAPSAKKSQCPQKGEASIGRFTAAASRPKMRLGVI